MDKTLFNDLVQSLKEAQAISKGTAKASRQFEMAVPDVKAAREKTGLSQDDFARLIHVSTRTLQNWEQHRRKPTGPAIALLKIVSASPELAMKSLHR
jgi:DNA-binding transcriptional regulator YiaG